MIERNDIRSAVAAGILSEQQAARLISLADDRRGARDQLSAADEPFELFKGFNEIFIVVGLLILAAGWVGVSALAFASGINNPQQAAIPFGIVGAITIWLLSEYFIRRRRMVAPAICLAILFGANAAFGLTTYLAQPFMVAQEDYSSLPLPLALGTAALMIYWLRFRVPFAMAMIAIGLFAVTLLFAAIMSGTPSTPEEMFLLSAGGPFAWITLALGIIVFTVAMVFDMSDPHRVSIRAANGFWLHVVAAPALVNTMALTLLAQKTAGANLLLLGLLAAFAYIAVVIDRRSFLIAAIGYIVVLASAVLDGDGAAITILILGAVLLLLGAFWERVRAVLLKTLPGFIPRNRLPPSI